MKFSSTSPSVPLVHPYTRQRVLYTATHKNRTIGGSELKQRQSSPSFHQLLTDFQYSSRLGSQSVKPRLHDTTCCQTGCQAGLTTGFDNRVNVCIHDTTRCQTRCQTDCRVYKHSTGCQTRLTTGLTNGCIVYTAGCQTGCQTRLTTGLTTGWTFVYTIQPVVKPSYNRFDTRCIV